MNGSLTTCPGLLALRWLVWFCCIWQEYFSSLRHIANIRKEIEDESLLVIGPHPPVLESVIRMSLKENSAVKRRKVDNQPRTRVAVVVTPQHPVRGQYFPGWANFFPNSLPGLETVSPDLPVVVRMMSSNWEGQIHNHTQED